MTETKETWNERAAMASLGKQLNPTLRASKGALFFDRR